ncbi:hypothetical protein FQP90_01785 [Paenarthrobacter nitroguajacolicus]|uniref:DUF6314 domain-containing protein n=1 Tax=Paenarthrobacter nitroguajacolicus TaxID=211146 RepID=A0A558HCT7_PAENT|nr:DUF6314 family protein [Paenarthrobacter nitroguajacolicus]TVU66894.1 hypothetical protein FQP90_01785 [Paenarthrobacter nitroguajacolicus]
MNHQQPIQDLRAYLAGSWAVERTLLDRASGTRGSFSGVVLYTENPDGGLDYREDGTMHWPTHTGPAFREYVLAPGAAPDSLEVFFPDGRPFHVMAFSEKGHEDKHWCDPDDYRVTYTYNGPDSFSFTWDVRGPAKDLLLESHLVRINAGRQE